MKILVGCEESQIVCKAFRERGHEAYSCDILPCSGLRPEWHLQMDIFKAVKSGYLKAQNGNVILIGRWDMGIFFPPCTYLTVAGNKWFLPAYMERFPDRWEKRNEAIVFFKNIYDLHYDRIPMLAIENPIGIMSTELMKPTQIIQPYHFGHKERKATCLWLEGLPPLSKTFVVEPEIIYHKSGRTDSKLHYDTLRLPKEERAKIRSKTFAGIAWAMATQWS